MILSAFPLLPNYILSNDYSSWVTYIDIWTLWNARSHLQVRMHIDMYCLPIDPAAPAHIGQNRASQRPHNAYPICNQMSRLNTPISTMLFFSIPSLQQIREAHNCHTLVRMDNTPLYRTIQPVSQNRAEWRRLIHKPQSQRQACLIIIPKDSVFDRSRC